MSVLMSKIARLARTTHDRGASAVEYGLLVAAIAAVIVGVVFGLGALVQSAFHNTCVAMASDPAGLGDPASCEPPAK